MDENDEKKARDLVTFDPEDAEGKGEDQELRYGKDPVDALRECRDRFQQNEKITTNSAGCWWSRSTLWPSVSWPTPKPGTACSPSSISRGHGGATSGLR